MPLGAKLDDGCAHTGSTDPPSVEISKRAGGYVCRVLTVEKSQNELRCLVAQQLRLHNKTAGSAVAEPVVNVNDNRPVMAANPR